MWKKLTTMSEVVIQRGCLIKFTASYPFEESVVMMVSGYPEDGNRLSAVSLITITGYKAGINAYVLFPEEVRSYGALTGGWLISNWNEWVWPDGNVNDVWVREPLDASEL